MTIVADNISGYTCNACGEHVAWNSTYHICSKQPMGYQCNKCGEYTTLLYPHVCSDTLIEPYTVENPDSNRIINALERIADALEKITVQIKETT